MTSDKYSDILPPWADEMGCGHCLQAEDNIEMLKAALGITLENLMKIAHGKDIEVMRDVAIKASREVARLEMSIG